MKRSIEKTAGFGGGYRRISHCVQAVCENTLIAPAARCDGVMV